MKKIGLLLAILGLSFCINGQTNSNGNGSEKGTATIKMAGIELPPEKSRPMVIPKLGAPVVIDGKPDEEIWKTAAVFKDFYQTGPGNNVAPSKPTEVYIM